MVLGLSRLSCFHRHWICPLMVRGAALCCVSAAMHSRQLEPMGATRHLENQRHSRFPHPNGHDENLKSKGRKSGRVKHNSGRRNKGGKIIYTKKKSQFGGSFLRAEQ